MRACREDGSLAVHGLGYIAGQLLQQLLGFSKNVNTLPSRASLPLVWPGTPSSAFWVTADPVSIYSLSALWSGHSPPLPNLWQWCLRAVSGRVKPQLGLLGLSSLLSTSTDSFSSLLQSKKATDKYGYHTAKSHRLSYTYLYSYLSPI